MSRPAALLALLAALAFCVALAAPGTGVAGIQQGASAAKKIDSIAAKKHTATKARKATRKTSATTALRRKITGLQVTGATATSVSLKWQVSPSSAGVIGYTVTRDGVVVATPTLPRVVVTGLQCGRTATIAVRARGYFRTLSAPTSITVSTDPCPDVVAPTTPTGLAVAGRTQSVLSLRWVAATDNVGVVDYEVFVGQTPALDSPETSVSIGGLICGTMYAVGVRSVDGAGNRSTLAQISASTSDCSDTQAPSTPTLTATLSGAKAQLSWTAASDNVGVSSYAVYQGASLLVQTTARQYTTGDLACGQSLTFGVEARDSAGNRSGRGTATVQAAACPAAPPPAPSPGDTSAPSAPGSLQVTGVGATSISLSWATSTDNVGVTAYGTYRNGTLDHSVTGLTSSFTGLACGTTYTLGVDAADDAGNRSARVELSTSTAPCPDAQAPTTPTNLRSTSVTQTSAAIAWDPSTDDVGIVGYGVYWSGAKIADTTDTSFVLTGLTCGSSTTVEVDAVDGSGNRSSKASRLVSTSACPDTQAPSAPTGLQAGSVTQTSLTLSWSAASDNVAVTGYDVYRNGTKVGSTTTLSQNLTGLACGTSYTLGVEAFDATGNRSTRSTKTATASACTDTQAPTAPTGLQVTSVAQTSLTVAWTGASDNIGVTGYGVFVNGSNVGTSSGTSYTVGGLSCGSTYTLAVDAYDAAGNRSPQATFGTGTAACSAPPSGASLYLSPTGNDAGTCTQAAPCRSFDRAYDLATPSQIVEAAGGTYGSQTLTGSKAAPGVTFRPAAGASVVVGNVDVSATNVTFDGGRSCSYGAPQDSCGIRINGWTTRTSADYVTFKDITHRGSFQLWSSKHVSMIGGESYCDKPSYYCDYDPQITEENGNKIAPTDGLIQGVYFHDWRRPAGSDWHTECLQVGSMVRFTITGNFFERCATHDIFVRSWGTINNGKHDLRDNVIQNNRMRAASDGGYYAIQFIGDLNPSGCTGNVIQYNTMQQDTIAEACGVTFRGNVSPKVSWNCVGTYIKNVFQDSSGQAPCGSSNKLVNGPQYGSGNLGLTSDLHLAPGSPAINAGDPASYPGADTDGQARPMGGAPDAGADESQ